MAQIGKEGALEEWDIYSWNGESWVYQRNDECFYATEESPWFEGYEAVFMQEHHLDGAFNQITSIEWYGDGWQDEEGNWKRSVRITKQNGTAISGNLFRRCGTA